MRNIQIDLSNDSIYSLSPIFAGIIGEHNESNIEVILPIRMISNNVSYYYFKFELEDGTSVSSPQISVIENQKVNVLLWYQITRYNKLKCNVIAEKNNNGVVEIIGKSPTFMLLLKDAAMGETSVYESNGNEEALQEAINMALSTAKDSGEFDGTDGVTPTIGVNGNWYLGDTDTGKPSRGKDGTIINLDQTYSPESVNAQSGVAVAEAISKAVGWETLVDITLTEEQAGVTTIKVEVDREKLMSFTQYFLYFEFNAPQDLTANSVWLSSKISDLNSRNYNYVFASPAGPITAVSQSEKVYGYCQVIWTSGAIQGLSTNLNKHFQANSRTNALYMNSTIQSKQMLMNEQPYLHFESNSMQIPAGTHIVLKGRR